MKPLAEAAAQVEAMMAAAAAEGVPDFVLNARTDAFVKAGDRDPAEVLADAVERGRAYLDAGAPVVFVPGPARRGAGHHAGRRVRSAAAHPDRRRPARCRWPGRRSSASARVSYGPNSQRVALTALQELVEDVHAGGGLPTSMRVLN